MEILNQIWVWILSAVGGLTLTGIITAIIYGSLRGAFNKTISKINVQKIADQATEKGVERVKKISFTHSIQPIVESELKKINEHSTEVIKGSLKETSEKYDKLINVMEKLSAYFDNSIGVSESAKVELREAIKEAKEEKPMVAESVVSDEVVVVEEKEEIKVEPTITTANKKTIKVER